MNSNESKLSKYIDSLNKEKKPQEHGNELETKEMEELFDTVRLVRSLKEPDIPRQNYYEELVGNLQSQLVNEKRTTKVRKKWLSWGISVAAVIALIFTFNILGNVKKTNVVYAMEQAFKEVKAYHGILEVMETNAEGKSTSQSEIEVWADKNGRYYVKGLEGAQKDLITINNGEKKWQVQPDEKEVDLLTTFPDTYSFVFEIGKEVEDVKNSIDTKVIGDEEIAGRNATIVEVAAQGGDSYKVWIDKETKMPIQKQSSMTNSIQYTVRYNNIEFTETIPKELLDYNVPEGFKEVNDRSEQFVNSVEEAKDIAGFMPKMLEDIPKSFIQSNISVIKNTKSIKINYTSEDNKNKVSIIQKKADDEFKPAAMSIIGKINNSVAEVQSPIENEEGILQGAGAYSGLTDISSVRWQQDSFEYAVIGNVSLEDLKLFVKGIANEELEIESESKESLEKPQVEVPINLEIEKADQKNADAGHSPWKLDPAFVSQVFVSLKISPEGIQGEYPIKYEELKIIKNTGTEVMVEVGGDTPIKKVYLKRLIRQDNTGIWTVVGYDPVNQ